MNNTRFVSSLANNNHSGWSISRRGGLTRRFGIVIAMLISMLRCVGASTWAQADVDAAIALAGLWRPVEGDHDRFETGSKLARLEVDWPNSLGVVRLRAFVTEGRSNARDSPWLTADLERQLIGEPKHAWLIFEKTEPSGNQKMVMLRVERPNRLRAVVRERPGRGQPERVGEWELERSEPAAPRPRSSGRPPLFRGQPAADDSRVFLVTPEGRDLSLIAEDRGFARAADPSWSPDGRMLVFVGFNSQGKDPLIHVVRLVEPTNSESKGATRLQPRSAPRVVATGVTPTWSPDSRRLAYVASGKPPIQTDWSAPGRNQEQIVILTLEGEDAGASRVLVEGIEPRWNPRDDRLAFVKVRGGNTDLALTRAQGGGISQLTSHPARDSWPIWTHDGGELIFLSNRTNRWDLFKIDPNQPERIIPFTQHRLREDRADLSPDSLRLIFTERWGLPDSRIVILDLSRDETVILTDAPNGDREATWSPDGRWIAFVSRRATP